MSRPVAPQPQRAILSLLTLALLQSAVALAQSGPAPGSTPGRATIPPTPKIAPQIIDAPKQGATTSIDVTPMQTSVGETVTLTFNGSGPCIPYVDWGAGETKSAFANAQNHPIAVTHQYASPGSYTIEAKGCGMTAARAVTVSALRTRPADVSAAGVVVNPASVPAKITGLKYSGGYVPAGGPIAPNSIGNNFPVKLKVEGTAGAPCNFAIKWPASGSGAQVVAPGTLPYDWPGLKFTAGTHTFVVEGVAAANDKPACQGQATLTVTVVNHPMAPSQL